MSVSVNPIAVEHGHSYPDKQFTFIGIDRVLLARQVKRKHISRFQFASIAAPIKSVDNESVTTLLRSSDAKSNRSVSIE